MGFLDLFRPSLITRPDYLASPWAVTQLTKVVYSDVFGTDVTLVNRADAMSIPAVSKARNLICATVAKLPIRAANSAGLLPDDKQPLWLYRTDSQSSPFDRMLWTLDDLLFYGRSLWAVTRGTEGEILKAERVRYDKWEVNDQGEILVNNETVDDSQIIYFSGPIEGVLDKDTATLSQAKNLASTIVNRVKTPIPAMEIRQTQDVQLEEGEAKALVVAYNLARRDPEGATVFTPYGVELVEHGVASDSGFAVEGRNAMRLDVANAFNIPAALLDGSVAAASLTYSTQEGRRNEFIDYGLSLWIESISGRLSMDDVIPRGQRVIFDMTDFLTTLPSPTGADKLD